MTNNIVDYLIFIFVLITTVHLICKFKNYALKSEILFDINMYIYMDRD